VAEPALSEVEWACRLHLWQSSRHGCRCSPNPWHRCHLSRRILGV